MCRARKNLAQYPSAVLAPPSVPPALHDGYDTNEPDMPAQFVPEPDLCPHRRDLRAATPCADVAAHANSRNTRGASFASVDSSMRSWTIAWPICSRTLIRACGTLTDRCLTLELVTAASVDRR